MLHGKLYHVVYCAVRYHAVACRYSVASLSRSGVSTHESFDIPSETG